MPVPDLVDDPRPLPAHLVGLPEDRDLLRQLRLQLGAFAGGQLPLVVAGEQLGDPDVGAEQRAAGCLGRMGREHELERDLGESCPKLALGHRCQLREGLVE